MEMLASDHVYTPSKDEPYMNQNQLEYYKNRLVQFKMVFTQKIVQNREKLKTLKADHPDILDRGTSVVYMENNLRENERYQSVINQIDKALERMASGEYGYCELTGEPIGLGRLEALPYASLSIQAIEEMEATRGLRSH